MISSRGVGGSIGVGWVLRRLLKRQNLCNNNLQICGVILNVWAPASNLSMIIAIYNGLDACWAGLGVHLVSLGC